jgi:two-component system, chemotaxis family, chemotaxis protein CheY
MSHTILLVDDSPTHRSLIKVFLMGRDCEFLEADSATEALGLLDTRSVDLAIVDVIMPGMDGIALVREIRRHPEPRVSQMPVVLLTAATEPSRAAKGMAAGANAVLHKPVSSAGVADVVSNLLRAVPEGP